MQERILYGKMGDTIDSPDGLHYDIVLEGDEQPEVPAGQKAGRLRQLVSTAYYCVHGSCIIF